VVAEEGAMTAKKNKSPAFQMYPQDFLADANTIVMTTEEVGAYFLLLCVCWIEGSLIGPDANALRTQSDRNADHPEWLRELAKITRMSAADFAVAWERRLSRCFVLGDDGRWRHRRLDAEREKQQAFSAKAAEAANARWHGPGRKKVQDANALRTHSDRNALQSSSITKGAASKAAPWMGVIRQCWKASYPDGNPPSHAVKLLRPLVDTHGIGAVAVELAGYLAKTPATYIDLSKFASTFGSWGGGESVKTSSRYGLGMSREEVARLGAERDEIERREEEEIWREQIRDAQRHGCPLSERQLAAAKQYGIAVDADARHVH
jgi:uncharacterized protein YdaU (DUF1376 family)